MWTTSIGTNTVRPPRIFRGQTKMKMTKQIGEVSSQEGLLELDQEGECLVEQ